MLTETRAANAAAHELAAVVSRNDHTLDAMLCLYVDHFREQIKKAREYAGTEQPGDLVANWASVAALFEDNVVRVQRAVQEIRDAIAVFDEVMGQ